MISLSPNTSILSIGAVIGAVVGIALSSLVWVSYNSLIGHPRIAEAARQSFVERSESILLTTKITIEESRRKLAEELSTKHTQALNEAKARNEAEMARLEQENADYETRLNDDGRSCSLDRSDIEWLRKP